MVNRIQRDTRRGASGALMIELIVAIALLLVGLVPLAYGIASERRLARADYQRAVAMEIVDGELEVLAAGGWRDYTNGTWNCPLHAGAAVNLPPGALLLTVSSNRLRLEWRPSRKHQGGSVVREVRLP